MIFMSVDLPAPFSPISATTSPRPTVRETSSSRATDNAEPLGDVSHLQKRPGVPGRLRNRHRLSVITYARPRSLLRFFSNSSISAS
jgi:hypothetical protein